MSKEKILHLKSGKFGALRSGHPWVFKRQLTKAVSGIKPGDIVSAISSDGKFAGKGYYNPKSDIAVRILTFDQKEPIDRYFFLNRISKAVEKRNTICSNTDAYRAVFSEADGLPGVIIDIYGDTAVMQILTLGMEQFKPVIADVLDEVLEPAYIYERSVSPFRKIEGLRDVTGWWGDEGRNPVEINEGGVKFLVDFMKGHKTGFYLDQRRSRMALANIAKGKRVLDLFCYTGGFSVSAAFHGASSVTGVDIKEDWLKLARENALLNGVFEKCEFIKADVFDYLKKLDTTKEKFDLIILDPPSFLKNRESVASAARGYKDINAMAMSALSEGGVLATFSCSHNMPNELFSKAIKEAALSAGKKITILKRCHQSEDHPIVKNIPETEYLKGYFLKVENSGK